MGGLWTAPITWVDGNIYTAADFNQQIRDNFLVLKHTRDDSGKILAFTSAVFDNLSGLNIPNLVPIGGANTLLGKNHFGASTLVLPVGTTLSSGNGSIWIEGTAVKYLNDVGATKTYVGTFVSTPAGAVIGSIWVDGNNIHYIDASGDERLMVGSASAMHSDAAAVGGSTWMETLLQWVRSTGSQQYNGHNDSHSDAAHGDVAHGDVAHVDTAHNDIAHVDVAHGDSHTDIAHGDTHVDHTDVGHADSHGDVAHSDIAHVDTAHSDTAHTDVAHGDAHTDTHTDSAHGDSHGDQPT